MSKKLRLLISERCNRSCAGCCNKDWDLKGLPCAAPKDLSSADEILLTGGEPMLDPDYLLAVIEDMRCYNDKARVYVYTAKVDDALASLNVLDAADGMTVTLHEDDDVIPFLSFADALAQRAFTKMRSNKSLRLNVFAGIYLDAPRVRRDWVIKDNIEWIKDGPLPEGEVFMRMRSLG